MFRVLKHACARHSTKVVVQSQQRMHLSLDSANSGFVASPSLCVGDASNSVGKGRAPGTVWKAYIRALRPFLTTEDDLASRGLAIYAASPFSLGIPGGKDVPPEIKNQQIVNICDRALTLDSPLLSDAVGTASYFETQFDYLASVEASGSSEASNKAKLATARQQLRIYQDAALRAYNADQERFAQMKSLDSTLSFTEWMQNYGIEYASAWLDLQSQMDNYKTLLGSSAGPLGTAMDLMLSARSKLTLQAGNNMPCSAQDLGPALDAGLQVDKNSIFYRPLYSLSGYDRCVDSWVSSFDLSEPPSIVLPLNFEAAADSTWASIGFPTLDVPHDNTCKTKVVSHTQAASAMPSTRAIRSGSAPAPNSSRSFPYTSDIPSSIEDLSFSMDLFSSVVAGSAIGKAKTITESQPAEASLSLYGLQAFDVDRGFWNLDGIWNFRLASGANKALHQPMMKVIRILCGYKVDLRVRSNPPLGAQESSRESILGIPLNGGNRRDGYVHYMTENDAVLIPQVLGVLARKF